MTFRRAGWLLAGVNLGFAYLNIAHAENYVSGAWNVVAVVMVLYVLLRD
jgi:hypothetical protein